VNEPSPLPGISTFDPVRIGLGALSLIAILSGQFVANGTLYILSFMGIAGGVIFALKDLLQPTGGGIYAIAFVGPLLTIALMIVLMTGLLMGLGTSLYIAFRRRSLSVAPRIAAFAFSGLAVCTFLGLLFSRSLERRPEFHGDPLFRSHYFIWPIAFSLLAFAYAKLYPNPRNA